MIDLRQATCDVLRTHGAEALQEPERFVASVLDAAELDAATAEVLASACDGGFLALMGDLLASNDGEAIKRVVEQGAAYLSQEKGVDEVLARELALGIAQGCAASVEEQPESVESEGAEAEPASEDVEPEPEEEPAPVVDDGEQEALDERVEAAVRHVAEEAEADEAAAEAADEAPAPKKRERRSKQARAAKGEVDETPVATSSKPAKLSALDTLSVPAWLGIAAACLVLGLVLGRFVLGGSTGGSVSLAGKTTVAETELDDTVAAYTYNGVTEQITARELIEQVGTLDSAKTEDGSYTLPAAEYAITLARNEIMAKEAENRGIVAADEDVAAYAKELLGTSDYDAIASAYGMDAELAEKLIVERFRLEALRKEVVGEETPAAPEAPETPAEGKEEEATEGYATYVIGLAGDEWDADKKAWTSEDGPYATALSAYDFKGDKATYEVAQAAYYVAYQQYTQKQTELSDKWGDFVNSLMSQATIEVGTLVS